MQNDKITLRDLSIFTQAEGDVFSLIDHTTTLAGKEALKKHIKEPPASFEQLQQFQEMIRWWSANPQKWTTSISSGTLVMLEKFFESADTFSSPPTGITLILSAFLQKVLNKNQYTFIQFSLTHLTDFLKGCTELAALLQEDIPSYLRKELDLVQQELEQPAVEALLNIPARASYTELSRLNFRARRELKGTIARLELHYARLDAWQSMARATTLHQWTFPALSAPAPLRFEAKGLYHPLLASPVAYDIVFDEHQNFLLLTGANMSGKTTFMRALGVSALLAHLGMGVPAGSMHISFLQGIITNMHVEDNILRGESYFFAEVLRMKQTAQKLMGDQPHLVLMDELFKGTNVHDAYECTRAVVEGLQNHPQHLMILSTHLHEVAHHFSSHQNILFSYFVTNMAENGDFKFTYELKQGISNDRIGYRILVKEGVIDLLQKGSKGH
jgi:DNA mismatch repair protein MutS